MKIRFQLRMVSVSPVIKITKLSKMFDPDMFQGNVTALQQTKLSCISSIEDKIIHRQLFNHIVTLLQ